MYALASSDPCPSSACSGFRHHRGRGAVDHPINGTRAVRQHRSRGWLARITVGTPTLIVHAAETFGFDGTITPVDRADPCSRLCSCGSLTWVAVVLPPVPVHVAPPASYVRPLAAINAANPVSHCPDAPQQAAPQSGGTSASIPDLRLQCIRTAAEPPTPPWPPRSQRSPRSAPPDPAPPSAHPPRRAAAATFR